jgi:tyrosinase
MPATRREQSKLSQADWQRLIDAISQLHGVGAPSPAYRDFVAVHIEAMTGQGMAWGVHTMRNMGMVGRNFLAWHRRFLLRFEQRLQQVDAGVSVPYWDWVTHRAIPAPLRDASLLQSWSVSRGMFDPSQLPSRRLVQAVMAESGFSAFQSNLEAIHGGAHNAIGGDMGTSRSPNDPIFWLHHANVDRLWARWQASARGSDPPNPTETLKPRPILGVKVASVLDISSLGYRYASR